MNKDEDIYVNDEGAEHPHTVIHIGTAYNVNPRATTVNNTFHITATETGEAILKEALIEKPAGKKLGDKTLREMLQEDMVDTSHIQKEILNYVSCIRPYVKDELDKIYEHLWARIVEHKAFSVDLYDPGKQPCKFNRNLVANIIHYLDSKGFYKKAYNSSEMTRALEGDDQHAIRRALRFDPDEKYSEVVDQLIEQLREIHSPKFKL